MPGCDGMQRCVTPLERVFVLLVILRGLRVTLSARRNSESHRGIVNQRPHFVDRLFFEMLKSHDDVGNLDAGVIDIVLYFNALARGAQHAHERVAEDRVAQMADNDAALLGFDIGVLDDGFSRGGLSQPLPTPSSTPAP